MSYAGTKVAEDEVVSREADGAGRQSATVAFEDGRNDEAIVLEPISHLGH